MADGDAESSSAGVGQGDSEPETVLGRGGDAAVPAIHLRSVARCHKPRLCTLLKGLCHLGVGLRALQLKGRPLKTAWQSRDGGSCSEMKTIPIEHSLQPLNHRQSSQLGMQALLPAHKVQLECFSAPAAHGTAAGSQDPPAWGGAQECREAEAKNHAEFHVRNFTIVAFVRNTGSSETRREELLLPAARTELPPTAPALPPSS